MAETSSQPISRSRRSGLLSGLLLGVIIALLFALLSARVKSGPLAALWSVLSGRNTRITSEGSVVEHIQSLQRLETVVYSMDKIVTGEKVVRVDPNLETQVRQEAERQLLEEAVLGGIMNTARQNARTTVTSLLLGLGFEKVEVD